MRRATLMVELTSQGQLPREFIIFVFGEIDTLKGRYFFDSRGAEEVMAKWRDYGNRVSIDYEHQALDPVSNGPVPAAGWADLELRADGLWAVNVDWTPKAAEMLAQREYRYISPAFYVDETNRIIELINVALTNLPATKRLQPLVARRDKETDMSTERQQAIVTKLSAITGCEGLEQIEAQILAWREASKQAEQLRQELEAVRAERLRDRQERLIERGQAEGKLTPAMLDWARRLDADVLEAYLSVAPRVIQHANLLEPMPINKTWVELSGPERAELYRHSPEEYRRLRRDALGY